MPRPVIDEGQSVLAGAVISREGDIVSHSQIPRPFGQRSDKYCTPTNHIPSTTTTGNR